MSTICREGLTDNLSTVPIVLLISTREIQWYKDYSHRIFEELKTSSNRNTVISPIKQT